MICNLDPVWYYYPVKQRKVYHMFKAIAIFFLTVAVLTAAACAISGDWILTAFNIFWVFAWAQMLRHPI